MNVLGQSEVDGKSISIEYRPKIVGGRDALLQKMNLPELGIAPLNLSLGKMELAFASGRLLSFLKG